MATLLAWVAMAVTSILLLPEWARVTLPAAGEWMRQSIVAAILSPSGSTVEMELVAPPALLFPTVLSILFAAGVGIAVRFMLDGSAWKLSRAAPLFQRVDPLAGLKRIFSFSTGLALLGNTIGLAFLTVVAGLSMEPIVALITNAPEVYDPAQLVAAARQALLPLLAAAAVLAACQWGWSRRQFELRMRMTPEEFSDESRSLQADPKIKMLREKQFRTATPVAKKDHESAAGVPEVLGGV